jgi:hypothetical protein
MVTLGVMPLVAISAIIIAMFSFLVIEESSLCMCLV